MNSTKIRLEGKPLKAHTPLTEPTPVPVPVQTLTTQVHIPCAGESTRMRPMAGKHTGTSKAATHLPGGKTILETILDLTHRHGLDDVYINTFFMREQMKSAADQSWQARQSRISYLDEPGASGSGGGLIRFIKFAALSAEDRQAVQQEKPVQAYPFAAVPQGARPIDLSQDLVFLAGDSLHDTDLSAMIHRHQEFGADITVICKRVPWPAVFHFGSVVTDNKFTDEEDRMTYGSGLITAFKEKPKSQAETVSNLISTFNMILSPRVLSRVNRIYDELAAENAAVQEFDLSKHVLEQLVNDPEFKLVAVESLNYWSDVGRPQDCTRARRDVIEGRVNIGLPADTDFSMDYDPKTGVDFIGDARQRWEAIQAGAVNASLCGNITLMPSPSVRSIEDAAQELQNLSK